MSQHGIPSLSVVVPVYGCRETLRNLAEQVFALEAEVGRIELIFVDDASADGSWTEIEHLKKSLSGIRAVRLLRNRGQHTAISVGIRKSTGVRVVIMDCDLENSPKDIIKLLDSISDTCHCVVGTSTSRSSTSWARRILRKMYARLLSACYMIDTINLGVSSFAFCAIEGNLARSIASQGDSSDPISLKILNSAIGLSSVPVETLSLKTRRSTYSFAGNFQIVLKSIVLSGKGFQIICIKASTGLILVNVVLLSLMVSFQHYKYPLLTNIALAIVLLVSLLVILCWTSLLVTLQLSSGTKDSGLSLLEYELENEKLI